MTSSLFAAPIVAASLSFEGVRVSYGAHEVVRNVNFSLAAGAIGCLLGPSGCGKTTVLRAIAGFEPVSAGRIALGDRDISTAQLTAPPEARNIGMVFQDYALFPHLDVRRNIAFGLEAPHLRASMDEAARIIRVERMLALTGLEAWAGHFPHQLSGGQQQRVALARALAPAPSLLLLDEPFSNLDTELRERLSLELRDILKESRTTALMVTHDQYEAFAIADVIGLMHAGQIEQWDTAYNLYHRPATRFAADFIGQGVFLPGQARGNSIEIELGVLERDDVDTAVTKRDVLLRPDDVVHDDASPVTAEVLRKSFRGAEFLYTLKLASGEQVLALVPSHHNHAIGERIGIRLEADHVVSFPKQ